jgi:hypothetical protein
MSIFKDRNKAPKNLLIINNKIRKRERKIIISQSHSKKKVIKMKRKVIGKIIISKEKRSTNRMLVKFKMNNRMMMKYQKMKTI